MKAFMSVITKPKPITVGILAGALSGGIWLAPTAQAQLVSLSQYNGLALPSGPEIVRFEYAGQKALQGPGTVVAQDSAGGSGTATGNAGSETGGPEATASVSCCNRDSSDAVTATGAVTYAFQITGADVDTTAIVDAWSVGTVAGAAVAGGYGGYATAQLEIIDASDNATLLDESVALCARLCASTSKESFISADQKITVTVGDVIVVAARAGAATDGPGTWRALVDPQILLDPSDPQGLSLAFSPGIQQPSVPPSLSVPESSTWAMLIIGFTGLGVAGWRRGRGPDSPTRWRDRRS
jgi:hypothetical protein